MSISASRASWRSPATAGAFGTFTLDTAGHWSYTASNAQIAVQQLGAGQSLTDSFTATSFDGTKTQLVTVTINGTNDVPVIGGVSTGSVTEDVAVAAGNLATSGALTIADVDLGQSSFVAQSATAGLSAPSRSIRRATGATRRATRRLRSSSSAPASR